MLGQTNRKKGGITNVRADIQKEGRLMQTYRKTGGLKNVAADMHTERQAE